MTQQYGLMTSIRRCWTMSKVCSEDAVRRALRTIEEVANPAVEQASLKRVHRKNFSDLMHSGNSRGNRSTQRNPDYCDLKAN